MKKSFEAFVDAFYALVERVEAGGCERGAVEEIDQEYALVMHPQRKVACVADKATMRPVKMRSFDKEPGILDLAADYMSAC